MTESQKQSAYKYESSSINGVCRSEWKLEVRVYWPMIAALVSQFAASAFIFII